MYCLIEWTGIPERPAQSAIRVDNQDRQNLFISKRDAVTTDEIYAMNADRSEQINLTDSAGMDAGPSWSRESDVIIFISTWLGNNQ